MNCLRDSMGTSELMWAPWEVLGKGRLSKEQEVLEIQLT